MAKRISWKVVTDKALKTLVGPSEEATVKGTHIVMTWSGDRDQYVVYVVGTLVEVAAARRKGDLYKQLEVWASGR